MLRDSSYRRINAWNTELTQR